MTELGALEYADVSDLANTLLCYVDPKTLSHPKRTQKEARWFA